MGAKVHSEPGVCRGAFPHDLFIWKGCGCLLSPAGRRRHRTDEKESQKPCEVKVVFTAPGLLWMFSVRDVGEHLQLCSVFSLFFFLNLYLSREGLLRTQTLFSAWTEIHAAVNVPLSSQPGSKSVSDIYFCVIFLIITFK